MRKNDQGGATGTAELSVQVHWDRMLNPAWLGFAGFLLYAGCKTLKLAIHGAAGKFPSLQDMFRLADREKLLKAKRRLVKPVVFFIWEGKLPRLALNKRRDLY